MLATRELLDSFHQYAVEQLQNGGASPTIDELYDRWRDEQERLETMRAINLGIEQIERGEGMTLEELKRRLQKNLGRPHQVK